MSETLNREVYLQKLINRMHNGEIKIITGSRRCGKSWLLKKVFKSYLLSQGVKDENIIIVSLDIEDEDSDEDLSDHNSLKKFLYSKLKSENEQYYIFLDEIQEVQEFEKLVNGLAAKENVDVYITGSNSKFLSHDIKTIFRGRGDEVRVYPFSFSEFCQERSESTMERILHLWRNATAKSTENARTKSTIFTAALEENLYR